MAEFTRLGLGAANLGNLYRPMSDDEAWKILETAWDEGIRYFDTAPHYGLGLSERRLGAFLATKPRDEYVVSTKVGRLLRAVENAGGALDNQDFAVPADVQRVWDFSADGIRRSLEESLARLGLDRVDILYLHDPERFDLDLADREAYPTLVKMREEGLVDAVGIGSMSVDALARAAMNADLDVLMVAGRLTLAEQPTLRRILPSAEENGQEIVAAGVFNSGLLAQAEPNASSRYEYGSVPPALLEKVSQIAHVCSEFGVDLPTAALQYPLRFSGVRSVVVGASSAQQLAANAHRMATTVPEELWEQLTERGLVG
ncbi:MAG: aldo/keto reductase [Thermomicrobiales bacterium]|nr:aldo/keto reductase [Thermomicrobiales bacterium]